VLTKRDKQIIRFIEDFGAITRKQVERLFFSDVKYSTSLANKRLLEIIKEPHIVRSREPYTNQYIYHLKGVKQLEHRILRSEFYLRLITFGGQIKTFVSEYRASNLRADAFCIYEKDGYRYYFCLEVQTDNKLDLGKYIGLYESDDWPFKIFPRVVVISDRKIEAETDFLVFVIGKDFEGWEKIFSTCP
jgi:hypothetical protein